MHNLLLILQGSEVVEQTFKRTIHESGDTHTREFVEATGLVAALDGSDGGSNSSLRREESSLASRSGVLLPLAFTGGDTRLQMSPEEESPSPT